MLAAVCLVPPMGRKASKQLEDQRQLYEESKGLLSGDIRDDLSDVDSEGGERSGWSRGRLLCAASSFIFLRADRLVHLSRILSAYLSSSCGVVIAACLNWKTTRITLFCDVDRETHSQDAIENVITQCTTPWDEVSRSTH